MRRARTGIQQRLSIEAGTACSKRSNFFYYCLRRHLIRPSVQFRRLFIHLAEPQNRTASVAQLAELPTRRRIQIALHTRRLATVATADVADASRQLSVFIRFTLPPPPPLVPVTGVSSTDVSVGPERRSVLTNLSSPSKSFSTHRRCVAFIITRLYMRKCIRLQGQNSKFKARKQRRNVRNSSVVILFYTVSQKSTPSPFRHDLVKN